MSLTLVQLGGYFILDESFCVALIFVWLPILPSAMYLFDSDFAMQVWNHIMQSQIQSFGIFIEVSTLWEISS
jgi:hypothetical protein